MKSKTILFIALLFSFQLIAQTNGINYKAVVKDDSGNILAGAGVTVEFNILVGSGQTLIYNETHPTTTDANGLIVLTIGQGTSSDVFDDIDWNRFEHYLNVKMDTGSGLVDLGTTQFEAVPYALQAVTSNVSVLATTANNIVLKNGSSDQFVISYDFPEDKLSIEEVGTGQVFEIKNGEVYLPEYAGTGIVNLSIDNTGKLVKKPRNNQKLGIYDYFDTQTETGYTIYRANVHFEDNTTLTGISALLLDNNSGTGGVANSNFVSIKRTPRSTVTGTFNEIYRITGNNTSTGVYTQQSSFTLATPGSNVIDNTTYIYYIEIYACDACGFREVSIQE